MAISYEHSNEYSEFVRAENFLTSIVTINFSNRGLHHGIV